MFVRGAWAASRMDLDSTFMPEREGVSLLLTLHSLSLQPSEAWTSVRRRGTWGHISVPPPSSFFSVPPYALSVTVHPRCGRESQAQVDPLECIVSVSELAEVRR